MPKYFDIHSHVHASQYDGDRGEIIKRLGESETYTITIGTDLESSKQAVALADKYPQIYACIGLLAVDKPNEGFDRKGFEELVKHPKVVAVGECGLDFFHKTKEEDYDRQRKIFLDQIDFAVSNNKPLMIHVRNAYEEILEIIEPLKMIHKEKLRGNIHFFASDWATAERFIALGFTLSFTGVITFAQQYDEVIRRAPLESLMAETDAPYVAPVPYRGKRNEPSYVKEVIKRIAEIRGESLEVVEKALVNNAFRMIR